MSTAGAVRFGLASEQNGVQAHEVGECPLRAGQRLEARRHVRLQPILVVGVERLLVDLPAAVGGQPSQVEGTEVASGDFGANARKYT